MTKTGITLYRIKALKDFSGVKEGELGGWIEKEDNLSQGNNCWVFDDAEVYGNATVIENAEIRDNARVHGCALISGNSVVRGYADVSGSAEVYGCAMIQKHAKIDGSPSIFDSTIVTDCAVVTGHAMIYDQAVLYSRSHVSGTAKVYGEAVLKSDCKISGNAIVHGFTSIVTDAEISEEADIAMNSDYLVVRGFDMSEGTITFYRRKDGKITVNSKTFAGPLELYKKHIINHRYHHVPQTILPIIKAAKKHFKLNE